MQQVNNIQPTVRADVRNTRKGSRVRMLLAGSGVAGALLIGGLFGQIQQPQQTNGKQAVAHIQIQHTTEPNYIREIQSSRSIETVPVSYTMSNDFGSMARQAAASAGISQDAFARQIQQESGFNPGATSPAGAVGIAQFMPATAASMGVNPYDPSSALSGAARMMAGLSSQFGGDYRKALAAYNAGAGAVNSAVARGGANWLSLMPAETQNYVATIMG